MSKPPARARIKPEGQWHHGDLRDSLIAWGTHLLDTEGVPGLSLRAAARLAGVSQGAPAHHFKDKNGLLVAIATQAFRDMLSSRLKRLAAEQPGDNAARLRAVILGYVEFAQAIRPASTSCSALRSNIETNTLNSWKASGASFRLLRDAGCRRLAPGSRRHAERRGIWRLPCGRRPMGWRP